MVPSPGRSSEPLPLDVTLERNGTLALPSPITSHTQTKLTPLTPQHLHSRSHYLTQAIAVEQRAASCDGS
jgi:hypothetical protein